MVATPLNVPLVTVLQVEHSTQSAIDVVEKSTGDLSSVVAQIGLIECDQRGDIHDRIARQTRCRSW